MAQQNRRQSSLVERLIEQNNDSLSLSNRVNEQSSNRSQNRASEVRTLTNASTQRESSARNLIQDTSRAVLNTSPIFTFSQPNTANIDNLESYRMNRLARASNYY